MAAWRAFAFLVAPHDGCRAQSTAGHQGGSRVASVMRVIAQRLWWSLAAADWLEAFAAHPRIGERATSAWSAQEQTRATETSDAAHARLVAGNRAYEQRFGYTFIVCATDKSADEILTTLEERLHHEPADELQIAADEQRKITEIRLNKLITT